MHARTFGLRLVLRLQPIVDSEYQQRGQPLRGRRQVVERSVVECDRQRLHALGTIAIEVGCSDRTARACKP